MQALFSFSALLSWSLALLALRNSRTILRPSVMELAQIADSIEVLIPARNEVDDIHDCVTSALAQTGLAHLRVTVLDDGSTDGTAAALSRIDDPRLTVLTGNDELPHGWIGKPWACARLAEQSGADYLVFIDADVRLMPSAIARTIALLSAENLALISPYPQQIATGTLNRLIQPLLQWSWFSTVPLRLARETTRPSLAVANGQFLVCRRSDYLTSGGHAAVRGEVLEDLMLLRNFYRHGLTGSVADGTNLAQCRMYPRGKDLIDGYTKSLWAAFGGAAGSIFINTFLITVFTLPLLGLFTRDWPVALVALVGASWGRLIVAVKTKQHRFPDALLHSISIAVFAGLNVLSWVRHLRGTNSWKGRAV